MNGKNNARNGFLKVLTSHVSTDYFEKRPVVD